MARKHATELTCDRCGYLERFPLGTVNDIDKGAPPGAWGFVQATGVVLSDLCPGCKADLKEFMKNATVLPGSAPTAEAASE